MLNNRRKSRPQGGDDQPVILSATIIPNLPPKKLSRKASCVIWDRWSKGKELLHRDFCRILEGEQRHAESPNELGELLQGLAKFKKDEQKALYVMFRNFVFRPGTVRQENGSKVYTIDLVWDELGLTYRINYTMGAPLIPGFGDEWARDFRPLPVNVWDRFWNEFIPKIGPALNQSRQEFVEMFAGVFDTTMARMAQEKKETNDEGEDAPASKRRRTEG